MCNYRDFDIKMMTLKFRAHGGGAADICSQNSHFITRDVHILMYQDSLSEVLTEPLKSEVHVVEEKHWH